MRSIWLRVWAEKKWARLNVVSSVAEIVLLLLLLLCLWFMLIGQRAGSYVDGQAGRQAGRQAERFIFKCFQQRVRFNQWMFIDS